MLCVRGHWRFYAMKAVFWQPYHYVHAPAKIEENRVAPLCPFVCHLLFLHKNMRGAWVKRQLKMPFSFIGTSAHKLYNASVQLPITKICNVYSQKHILHLIVTKNNVEQFQWFTRWLTWCRCIKVAPRKMDQQLKIGWFISHEQNLFGTVGELVNQYEY